MMTIKRRTPESPTHDAQDVKRRRVGDDLSCHDVAVLNDCEPNSQDSKSPTLAETFSDSSATLASDSPPVDKGKDVERDPVLIELESLREQVTSQAKLLKAKEVALERIEREISCSICMDVSPLPYILPACGHIYCHGCLAKWFTTPQEGEVMPEPQPRASDTEDSSSDDAGGTDPPPGDGPPPVFEPPPPVYRNVKDRVKICPFCRAVVTDRPTPLRSFVSIAAIIRSEEKTVPPNYSRKNWKNIFRLKPSDKPAPGAPRSGSVNSDDAEFRVQLVAGGLPPPFVDVEDGVRRCGLCFHELWHGRCSNDECQADYDDPSDSDGDANYAYLDNHAIVWMDRADDGDFEDEGEGGLEGSFIYSDDDPQERDSDDFIPGPPRRLTRELSLADILGNGPESESESDAADGFVQRHNRRRRIIVQSSSGEDSDGPLRHVSHIRGPTGDPRSARWLTSDSPLTVESGEEEDGDPGPSHRPGRRKLIVSDDEEKSNDPGLCCGHDRKRLIIDDEEEESNHSTTGHNNSRRERVSDTQADSESDVLPIPRRWPARFIASNDEDEDSVEELNVERSIGSVDDSSSILSIPDGIRARNIEGYISDSSRSHSRSHEEEFLGFDDSNIYLNDEQCDPGSDASAANPLEEDDEEGDFC